jgi:phosphonate transport system substrate-binding protein
MADDDQEKQAGKQAEKPAKRPGAGRIALLAVVVGLVVGASIGYVLLAKPSKPELVIALQPTSSPQNISAKGDELRAFLQERLPEVEVKIHIPTDTAVAIASLKAGQAHVALLGAWPAVLANQQAGSEIVLAEKREVIIGTEKKVETYYFSYFVSLKSKGWSSLDNASGGKVCFTSKSSTSGYLFPLATLVKTGRIPAPPAGQVADASKFFAAPPSWAGNYQACWESLKQGNVDVGVIAGDVPESLYNEVLAGTDILETNGPVPSHTVVFSKDLQEPLRSKVQGALMELGKPEHRNLMRKLVSSIFVEFVATTTAAHSAGLKEALDLTHL